MKKAELYKKKRGEVISAVTLGVCMSVLVAVGVNLGNIKNNDDIITNEITASQGELVAFASKDELISKLESNAKQYENQMRYYTKGGIAVDGVDIAVAESAAVRNDASSMEKSAAVEDDYSTTNVQTEGVDESDIIKTDGKRIYYMNSERKDVKVLEDVDNNIHLIKTITLKNDETDYCYGDSMYLDDNYLVVISRASKRVYDGNEQEELVVSRKIAYYPYRSKSFTQISIYDINTYELIRQVETEGDLLSSRKIGNNLYLVSNKYLYYYAFVKDDVMPLYKDTLVSNEYQEADISTVRAFKGFENEENCNYMIVTSLDISNKNGKVNMDTYLGAGSDIYCSTSNLYVTRPNYNYTYRTTMFDTLVNMIQEDDDYEDEITSTTSIHKFAIKDGKTTYVATGKVNGTLLNQFSMDEYKGNFRITTTDEKGNNLYILDANLKQIGSLENLANGERIYSTRFMGDKAYVVTYKTVDPLFVIDLSNPYTPKVLGELKIPGYSSYLHPLGDHYLLGFGEDSVEKSYINWQGEQDVVAYATGLKMAIFDVSNYSNPREVQSVKIGGRGSYSELLYNHKALLLDEDKKIFAFPVSLNKEGGYYEDGTPKYGDLDFAGALVYNIDVEEGFELKGKITHEAEDRYSKYGNIERIIYIGNKLYTVSNGMIKSTDMDTMEEISSLKLR